MWGEWISSIQLVCVFSRFFVLSIIAQTIHKRVNVGVNRHRADPCCFCLCAV